ncbi:MAG: PEP-CTERM sorting domain-containing protein [Gemmatales bacterium]|nr:PEP-CTERM sorting domain-containing protein [Gemmatales bacterium]MDW8387509.1 PEP-CTERM sorting domain-containing protein [Gemmatales bacterium]
MQASASFRTGKVLLALAALALTAGMASASPFTLTYDFAGGPGFNPPPFGPTSISPAPPFAINPTFSASSAATGFPAATTAVRQSASGLGVSTIQILPGVFTEALVADQLNQVDGYGIISFVLFGIPLGPNNLNPEILNLTFSETDGLVVNTRLTQIDLALFNNTDPTPDFQILLNGTPIGLFDLASTIVFSTPIPINNGDVLSFIPLTPVAASSNGFALRGLQIQADILPEPGTLALFGVGLLGVVGITLRRRKQPVA